MNLLDYRKDKLVKQEDRTGKHLDSDEDLLAEGMEIRSIHVGGGQLWDGPGPVDGGPNTQDGMVIGKDTDE